MDYLEKAKDKLSFAESYAGHRTALFACAYALIALVERLDKLTMTDGNSNKAIRTMESKR